MKYTKEYCKENKIAISVVNNREYEEVNRIFKFDSPYKDMLLRSRECNFILESDGDWGHQWWYDKNNFTVITFEELMQDLNQNNMKRYKNKIHGDFCTEIGDNTYQLSDCSRIHKKYIENSQDWEEVKPEFKVGDIVSTLSGFSNDSDKPNYVGAGYKKNYIFEVNMIETASEGFKDKGNQVIWDNKSNGVYSNGIRLATSQEIQQYKESQELKIGDYKLEIIRGDLSELDKAKFGCQEFDINELRAFKRLVSSPIDGKLSIQGVNIDSKLLDKIIAKF